MNIIDAAYMAGIIDGEGTIAIVWGAGRTSWKPIVQVDNTDYELIQWLVDTFGGTVVKKKKLKDHHRQCWTWRMTGGDKILSLLKDVTPYMKIECKKQRAALLLGEYKALTPRNGYYTDEIRQRKIALGLAFLSIGQGRGSQNHGSASRILDDGITLEK